jgi:hypothetical protein
MLRPTVSRLVYLWIKHPSWAYDQSFISQTVAGLLMGGVLFDERTGLSFTIAAGPHQRSHFRVWVPWDSWPYFTVSDLRLPFWSPPTTRRVTVEVFIPCPTTDGLTTISGYSLRPQHIKDIRYPVMDICESHRKSLLRHWFHCCIHSAVAQQRKLSDCFLHISCRGIVFTEPLPRNGSIFHNIYISRREAILYNEMF